MGKKIRFIGSLISVVIMVFANISCADKLNEDRPENSKKLAKALGISYPIKSGGAVPTSNINSFSDTVSGKFTKSGGYIIYTFYAYSKITYTLSWMNGSGAKISVSAGTSSSYPTSFFSGKTSGQQTICSYSGTGETVYIKVMPYNSSYVGTFSLTVSNSKYNLTLSKYSSSGGATDTTVSTLKVGSFHSAYVEDDADFYLPYGDSKEFSFRISSGYIMYIQYFDSRSSTWSDICSNGGRSAGRATPVVYNSSGAEFGTIDSMGLSNSQSEAGGNYKVRLTASSSGYVAIRVFQMPTAAYVTNTISVATGKGSRASDLTTVYFSSYSACTNYKFYAISGTKYNLRFYDSDTKSSSSISASNNFTDALGIVYSVTDGGYEVYTDSDEFSGFTPTTSGYYILSVGKSWSGANDGYVGFRLYK